MKILLIHFILNFFLVVNAFGATLQTVAFGKQIDLKDWSEKIALPLDQLVESIQNRISVYRYTQNSEAGSTQSSAIVRLNLIPQTLFSLHKKEIFIDGAVGVYMSPKEYGYYIQRPTLLLREDATHWTVIHEYTHYLFDLARTQNNQDLPSSYLTTYKDHTETLQESFAKFRKNGLRFIDKAHYEELILCLKVSADIRLKMLLKFELEEITVESMLRQFYKVKFDHPDFDRDYYQNSARYIAENLKRTQAVLDAFLTMINEVSAAIPVSNSDQVQLQSLKTRMLSLKNQIKLFKM